MGERSLSTFASLRHSESSWSWMRSSRSYHLLKSLMIELKSRPVSFNLEALIGFSLVFFLLCWLAERLFLNRSHKLRRKVYVCQFSFQLELSLNEMDWICPLLILEPFLAV